MRKKTKKSLIYYSLVAVIFIFILYIFMNYKVMTFLDFNGLNINKTGTSFGYTITAETDTDLQQTVLTSIPGCTQPVGSCAFYGIDTHNNNFLFGNSIGTEISSSLDYAAYDPNYAGGRSIGSKSIKDIMYTEEIINISSLYSLNLEVQRAETKSGSCSFGNSQPPYGVFTNKIHLINDYEDIILLENSDLNSVWNIKLYRVINGFSLETNNNNKNININNGNYRILLESYFSGTGTSDPCRSSQTNTFKITILNISEVIIPETNNTVCVEDNFKCEGYNYSLCEGNTWLNLGLVDGKCGYVLQQNNTNNQTNQNNSQNNQSNQNNQTANNQTNATYNKITCWKVRDFLQQGFFGEESPCYNYTILSNKSGLCGEDYYDEDSCKLEYTSTRTPFRIFWDEYGLYIEATGIIISIIFGIYYFVKSFKFKKKKKR